MKPEIVDEIVEPSGRVIDIGVCDLLVDVKRCSHEAGK